MIRLDRIDKAVVLPWCTALIAGVQLSPYVLWSSARLTAHDKLLDDAFFYSVLVRNFLDRGFFTFDGTMETNGFQPLWAGLLLCLSYLSGADPAGVLCFLSWASYVAFVFLVVRYVQRLTDGRSLLATIPVVCLVLNPRFQHLVVQGLEIPLALTLLVGTATYLESLRIDQRALTRIHCLLLGMLAGFTFLARTDLFLVAVVLAAILFIYGRSDRVGVLVFCAGCAVLVVPYLVANYLAFDSVVPISGRVKRFEIAHKYPAWRDYFASRHWEGFWTAAMSPIPSSGRLPTWLSVLVSYVAIAGAVYWGLARGRLISVRCLALVVGAHLLFMQVYYKATPPFNAYYFAPEVVFLWLVISVGSWPKQATRVIVGFSVVCLVVGLARGDGGVLDRSEKRLALCEDIRQRVPEGERLGAYWPGIFAEFSGRPVVPLDGLVGSPAFFEEVVKTRRQLDYLLDNGVHYLALELPMDPERYRAEGSPDPDAYHKYQIWSRADIDFSVVAAQPYDDAGNGWYLMELNR